MELKLRKRIINKYYGGKVVPNNDGEFGFGTLSVNMPEAYHLDLQSQLNKTPNPAYSRFELPMWKRPIDTSIDTGIDVNSGFGEYKRTSESKAKDTTRYAGTGIGNIVTSGVNFVGDLVTDFNSYKREDEILGDSGISLSYINGVGWQRQNDVNYSQQMREQNAVNEGNAVKTIGSGAALGAAVGSIIPGVGTVIGGVVGGLVGGIGSLIGAKSSKNKLRKRIYNAQQLANRTNTYNSAGAFSTGLQQDYYLNNADTQGGVLHANKGKDLKKPKI